MPRLFTGTHTHKLEGRGRVSIPSDFRKVFRDFDNADIYLVPLMRSDEAHICFSAPGYDAMIARFDAQDHTPEQEEAFEETVIAATKLLVPDDAGRIVLPKEQIGELELNGEIRFVGKTDYFELWRPDVHEARVARVKAEGRKVAGGLRLRGLHR